MELNFFHFLILPIIIFTLNNHLFHLVQPLCLEEERISLLQFKHSLIVNNSASKDPKAYPKTTTWTIDEAENGTTECCWWDGISCDEATGHVISLDLSSSFLYGSIHSNSALFELNHLESLNLGDNNFNNSRLSAEFGRFSNLTHLNLSSSSFVGILPSEMSLLSNLVSIDLTLVNISSNFPDFFVNFSSLAYLVMKNSGVYGQFPENIFHLPKIEYINAQHNPNLTGHLPEFKSGSSIRTLWFCRTNFSGSIPYSIGNLRSLEFLSFARTKLSGYLPSSFSKLTNLTYLDLSYNSFVGEVPLFLRNLTKLNVLWFGGNQLTGQIPPWIGNLTELAVLSLAKNKLTGRVPPSILRLKNLRTLNLFENSLNGSLDFAYMFQGMKSLAELRLDGNELTVITEERSVNGTFGKFEILGMNSCNLSRFPDFLRYQDSIRYLDLGGNSIHGPIPKWVWSTSNMTLAYLALNDNSLTSIEEGEQDLNLFCNLSSLQLLDLSNNLLSQIVLPKCLENPRNQLSVLNVKNNLFHGEIPQMCSKNGSSLKMIDLSYNNLNCRIPRSMSNCLALESLSLANNRLLDIFPWWLGNLPKLRLLILRSNQLHGEITVKPNHSQFFSNLRVIDLSHNNFTGKLPSKYFESWNAMKVPDNSNSYLKTESSFEAVKRIWFSEYTYSTTITIKGTEVRYGKIQEILVLIDLSSNNFDGEIPDSIGSFQGIRVLNLSNNALSGEIPSSIGNITRVESLDLSRNLLTGEIPQKFVDLTFLSFFNVSYNRLEGRVPRGNQLDTFENSSYIGNLGLCGVPLTKMCGDSEAKEDEPGSWVGDQEEDNDSESLLNWVTIGFGYFGGLVAGVIIENIFLAKRRKSWIAKTCSRKRKIKKQPMYESL